VFTVDGMCRRQLARFAIWIMATASNTHGGADIASNGPFHGRVDVPIIKYRRCRKRWFGLGRGAQKVRAAND